MADSMMAPVFVFAMVGENVTESVWVPPPASVKVAFERVKG